MNRPSLRHSVWWKILVALFALLQSVAFVACRAGTGAHQRESQFGVALLTPGPVSDGGWNAAAYDGVQLIKEKLGARTALVQTTSPADFEDSMRDFASRGFDLIFAHGFRSEEHTSELQSR